MPTIEKLKRKDNNRVGNAYDADRRKIYNSKRWKKLRGIKLINTPLCEICERNSLVVSATDVHHIKSFMKGTDIYERSCLAYDYGNLMSLCDECHSRIHASERNPKISQK